MPTKIAFFESNPEQQEYITSKLGSKFDLQFFQEPINQTNISKIKDANILGIFIGSQISEDILKQLPSLKLVTTMSTGFDHINLEAANKHKITVCNVPTYGENTVAEHTFALILTLSRKVIEANQKVKLGIFDPKGLVGFDLKGKTLGVIGTGNIGKHVIQIADGFSMKILAFDLNPDSGLEREFNLKYVNLEELFKNSDIITLHVPYNQKTHHLINKQNISLMKKGVIIINTARGGLVERQALYEGITSGKVQAAGLDVLEEEHFLKEEAALLYKTENKDANFKTVITNHVLINHPHVLVTPHSAFNSNEAIKRILDTTIKNIVSFELKKPVNEIDT